MDTKLEPLDSTHLVALDADHPGFRDADYRARRAAIAGIALRHRAGSPVPDAPYSAGEEAVWRTVWTHLAALHERWVCTPLQDAQDALGLSRGAIPQLSSMSERIEPATGFRMEPVAGLVTARDFLAALRHGVFLSTQYIRHASRPLYTPEPDIVHEAVGHAASLTHPVVARVSRAFGAAVELADEIALERLNRVYWFTMEFGVVREGGEPRAFGAGLLSSAEELARMANGPRLVELDLDVVARTPYDPTDMQPELFVAPGFDELLGELLAWLESGGWMR